VTPSHQHAHMSRALQDSQQTTQDSRPCQPGLVFEQRSICPAQTVFASGLYGDVRSTRVSRVEWSSKQRANVDMTRHSIRTGQHANYLTSRSNNRRVCTVEMDRRYDIKWLPAMHSRHAPTTTALRFTEFRQRADRIDLSATAKSFTTETS